MHRRGQLIGQESRLLGSGDRGAQAGVDACRGIARIVERPRRRPEPSAEGITLLLDRAGQAADGAEGRHEEQPPDGQREPADPVDDERPSQAASTPIGGLDHARLIARRMSSHAATSATPAIAPSIPISQVAFVPPRSMTSWASRIPWVTGRAYAATLNGRDEFVDRQDKAREEHRAEQHQQCQLDGLSLGIRRRGRRPYRSRSIRR